MEAQQTTLLGHNNENILYDWKNQPENAKLTGDDFERVSYILGIYESLQFLFPDPSLADQWLSMPNDNPLFYGTVPLDGHLGNPVLLRNFLETELEGNW